MKKFAMLALVAGMFQAAQALTPGAWNPPTPAFVDEVVLKEDGVYFKVRNPAPGDAAYIYGASSSSAHYDVFLSMLLTAKSGALPVSFYVEPAPSGPGPKTITVDGKSVVSIAGFDLTP